MIIFADKQTHNQSSKQILNSKTEAHSYPLWIVGERANCIENESFLCHISCIIFYSMEIGSFCASAALASGHSLLFLALSVLCDVV